MIWSVGFLMYILLPEVAVAGNFVAAQKITGLQKRRETVLRWRAQRIERQHKAGKMTARERIAAFFDPARLSKSTLS